MMEVRNCFEWLSQEIAEIRTNKFFVVDGPATEEFKRAVEQAEIKFPISYKIFVVSFGNAKLYRLADGYELGVLAAPREAESANGEKLWYFGFHSGRRAYFMDSLLDETDKCPVFESLQGGVKRVADGFATWLRDRATLIRRRIGKRRWKQLANGPRPFSDGERRVVEARRKFHWHV